MKFTLLFIVALCLGMAHNAPTEDLDAELADVEKGCERDNTLDTRASKELAMKDSADKDLDDSIMKDLKDSNVLKKDNSVEAQLDELLKSTEKDTKQDAQSKLHEVLNAFENSDVIDKDKLLKVIEKFMKDELASADAPEEEDSGDCADVRKDCAYLARQGFCGSHRSSMKQKCAKTCQFCVDCKNSASESKCKELASRGLCEKPKYRKMLKAACFKSCGYCKPGYVPECTKTEYGCCWDKLTASNKAGTNCPECKNRYPTLCKRFAPDCAKNNAPGKFMRHHCPKQCGVCGNKCEDSVEYAKNCPLYAKIGMCKNDKSTMQLFCKKTCNLC